MIENEKKKVRIMIDFCATIFHHGHIRLIKNAKLQFKNQDPTIVIGLASDEEILKHKGYVSELNFEIRKEILLALRDVDEVVSAPWCITDEVLKKYNIDYLVHGSDNQNKVRNTIIFQRTEDISSNILRSKAVKSIVQERNSNKVMFTPGPSNMSYLNMFDLRSVFGRGDTEYIHIEKTVLQNILNLTGHDKIVRFQGGGTTAIDVATSNIVLGKILIIDAGYYSRRIKQILINKSNSLPSTSFKIIKYDEIGAELLISDTYDWIATAYAETADAFLSDINLLKRLAEFKKAKLYLDATASINLEPNHNLADACSFSSCKGLGGLTGAAFITFKEAAYQPEKRGDVPYTLNIDTHLDKLYTGPYHAICSLYSISKSFDRITKNVKQSKLLFLEKYKDRIIRPAEEQPIISTIFRTKSISTTKNAVLYQPRVAPPETAIICHFGDMFTSEDKIGQIYDTLIVE
ncbi:MAG: adenylyltransferase/cytidyltransferase family protein [Flavobacteriaceae bacterium]